MISSGGGCAANVMPETNDCSSYFQQLLDDTADVNGTKWSGLIEFGVHGRPIINFELQKSHYHVLLDILDGNNVAINVSFPSKFQKSILKIVSIELDYQVICEDKNVRKGELFSFDFKFKAPSELIKRVSEEIEYDEKGLKSIKCGVPHVDESSQRVDIVKLDEDRLDSKIWPWIASLYVRNKYRCTVTMITRSEGVTAANCLSEHSFEMRIETYNNKNFRVRNAVKNDSLALIFLEDGISDPDFVPACLSPNDKATFDFDHGSVIGFEKKFHEDYVVLNRVNMTSMSIKDCISVKNGTSKATFNESHFCGISKNGLTWLELDGLDGAGYYTIQNANQWFLDGIIYECLKVNNTDDCDFDSPIIIVDLPNDWVHNLTLYHPLGLQRRYQRRYDDDDIHDADSTKSLTILLILTITLLGIVAMWALWYVLRRRRSRPLISEVPSILSTNDGIQLLKRENKRFSYLN
ncbi:uncharacterized protein LOC134835405 [Culicoides brevitarsis]|uniref:uncharacterized protein LOC134835405 n=1 Tax=Culicoides brevitarsis TaxID=469753 RepID=UPI00307B10EE